MHNVFNEVIHKTGLSSNDDKRMQSIDSIKIYAYGTSKDILFIRWFNWKSNFDKITRASKTSTKINLETNEEKYLEKNKCLQN